MTEKMQQSTSQQEQQAGETDYERLTLDIAALSQNQTINRYGYLVGGMGLLVPANTLSEVLRKFTLYPIPKTRAWLRGLVNLRGNLIPVYDLAMLCGLSDSMSGYDSLLILDKGADAVGILINNLPVVCDVDNWEALDVTSCEIPSLVSFAIESYRHGDMIWTCFDHKEYFRSLRDDVACD